MNYIMFGKRIRKCRKAKRMTQEELAEAVGISLSFFGHIERGTRKASMETLIRIASTLGVTPDELLRDSIPVPEDHFAVIRRALDLLEAEYKGTKPT